MYVDGVQEISALVIDHDVPTLEALEHGLAQPGLKIYTASNPQQGLDLFSEKRPQIVITDLMLPGMTGIELLEKLIDVDPGVEVILMSGEYSAETALQAIQKGAADYINKPVPIDVLKQRISRPIAEAKLREASMLLDRQALQAYTFEGIIGRSPAMLEVFSRIRRVAPHFRNILVSGPTGSGKELVANALHKLSPAKQDKFAVCNCSALVDTLFESELFGYVKGAFTGATQDKIGLFEYANGGTVFLDEIGELPLVAQAKLLRVLENQEIQRVGSPVTRKVDVRVVAATHRNLRAMVAQKTFREDLYYRLSMVEIHVPRLQQRREDLPFLERHFVEHFSKLYNKPVAGISRRAQLVLANYSWPGNVRELENVTEFGKLSHEMLLIDRERGSAADSVLSFGRSEVISLFVWSF
ncbi:MAG: Fis family transcriptional regulator [Acidobacteriales bacterium]|nr:Fis family transcriptional regulator [Terriglobales bacterium]